MEKLKSFALKRPFLFGLVLIFIYALLGTITYPAHFLFPETEVGQLYGDALSKFIIFLVFLLLLWRFGWLKASRLTSFGDIKTWLIVAVIVIYKILAELYAFTGDISIALPNSQLGIANFVLPLTTGLVEETMVRALALVAMVIAWGDTKQGQVKAVILSSLFFGLIHMFNLFVRPPGVVLFQALVVILPGTFYAPLVLTYRSLWPAIIIHWLTNAAVNIKVIGYENYQETFMMWVIFAIALIPLMAYSAYLIWKLPEPYQYELENGV